MQGLAVADFLTAFSSYGLKPLFQSKYVCTVIEEMKPYRETIVKVCTLPYPEFVAATHMSISSVICHTSSYMITTCLWDIESRCNSVSYLDEMSNVKKKILFFVVVLCMFCFLWQLVFLAIFLYILSLQKIQINVRFQSTTYFWNTLRCITWWFRPY